MNRKADISKDAALAMLRCMLLARRIEERMVRLYHQGQIFGGVYTGIGQEAIGTATTSAAGPDDLFAPCIRDMTVHVGRGTTALTIFRQFLGRVTGPTRGRDGNVHYGEIERGVFSMISHLGAMLPVVTGGVMARRRLGRDTIGFAYIGDGGTSTGDFHEAINFAAVLDVPVIFVVENNQFAYSTPTSYQFRCKNLVERAAGYGIEGFTADGNDAWALRELVSKLAAKMRQQPRPVLLVCETLRMRGHGEHDDASYIPRELLAAWAKRDPIALLRERITQAQFATATELAALEQAVQTEVDESYQQALNDPLPDAATLTEGVYADG
ncbi:MAG: thiamine pyrophosphate-dependent dehydrogenase E1 component subunit alpha [Verrucomicrobia bacterium]|nr:MAG: thiamine pyrophosphate-dependent dehydrogenase E1 component subunit alpha [Verrucomicrobiota bacterium]